MGHKIYLTDQGQLICREAKGNGTSAVTLKAPASLAANIDFILPTVLPAAQEFLSIDSSGQLSTSAGASGTIDEAYDSGGAGAGRIATTDTGPLEAAGAGGFLASHSAPVYGLETTGVGEYNFRLTAGQTTDILEIQRGDQDADISNDTFDALFALDGVNRRLGINTAAPLTLAHLLSPSGDAKLTIQAPIGTDASVIFNENSTARFELGYDDSAGGFVIGRLSFTNPALFVEDTTGDVGIGELVPDAKLHVNDSAASVVKVESTVAGVRIVLVDSTTSDDTKVGLQATGDDLELVAAGAVSLTVGAAGLLTAAAWNIPATGQATFGDSASGADTTVTIMAGANTQDSRLAFGDTDSAIAGRLLYLHGSDLFGFTVSGGSSVLVSISGTGLGVGVTAQPPTGASVLGITNGTAPSDTPLNGVVLYSLDVSSSAELHVRDEAGNVTVLSPHSEPLDHQLSEDMAWSFHSERDGKYVWVDMMRVVRALERLTGEELVHIGSAA